MMSLGMLVDWWVSDNLDIQGNNCDIFNNKLTFRHTLCNAARQKEKAVTSVSELLQAVKRPRALSESANRPLIRKSEGDLEQERTENASRRKSESVASFGRKSHAGNLSMHRISELPEKKHKKFRRRSFMGYDSCYSQILSFSFIIHFSKTDLR